VVAAAGDLAREIAQFLDHPLDDRAMAGVVDADLYRNRVLNAGVID
jgi:hypothetical protein